jgi:hypothetical protein
MFGIMQYNKDVSNGTEFFEISDDSDLGTSRRATLVSLVAELVEPKY